MEIEQSCSASYWSLVKENLGLLDMNIICLQSLFFPLCLVSCSAGFTCGNITDLLGVMLDLERGKFGFIKYMKKNQIAVSAFFPLFGVQQA